VLDVNQDPLGQVAKRIKVDGEIEIWSRPLHDGTIAMAVFNRGIDEGQWTFRFSDVDLTGKQPVRDLWQQKDYGDVDGNFAGRFLRMVRSCSRSARQTVR
jgi:alpha-galactosidase